MQNQYTLVFSTPLEVNKVQNSHKFFMEDCPHCKNEIVHICIEDHPQSYTSGMDSGYVFIDERIVKHTLKEFSNSLAAGIDGIPSILMKKCADSLSGPLTLILKQSYDLGYLPGILKLQLILPQHKSGSLKSKPSSFRPISLTSQISKLMEKILKNNIISHLEDNNLLTRKQHGLRKRKSCISQLLDHA